MARKEPIPVDVICQHSTDGSIYPIKIRVTDEDGVRQVYIIHEYTDLSHQGSYTLSDGVTVANDTLVFDCKISIFDETRHIRLYYRPSNMIWKMTTG